MIPLPLQDVLGIFGQQVIVFDAVITLDPITGAQDFVEEADRTIFGIIAPARDLKTNLLADGAISSGDLIMHTTETLSMVDLKQMGAVNRQTYVRYEQERWTVVEIGLFKDKTGGSNVYKLEKYVDRDMP